MDIQAWSSGGKSGERKTLASPETGSTAGADGGRRRREQAGCRAPGPRRRGRRSGGVPDAGEKGFPGEGVTDCIKRSGQVKSRTGQGDGHWSRRVERAQEELQQEDTEPRQPSL